MRNLSIIGIILLMVILPSCKFFKGKKLFNKKADVLKEWQVKQDSIRVADSLRKVQDELLAIESARIESERLAEEERLALLNKLKYNIIVGSFITPEYAKALAQEYRKLGYDAKILQMEGSRFELVAAEGHANFRNAVSRLRQFQDTVLIDAWMYIKK